MNSLRSERPLILEVRGRILPRERRKDPPEGNGSIPRSASQGLIRLDQRFVDEVKESDVLIATSMKIRNTGQTGIGAMAEDWCWT